MSFEESSSSSNESNNSGGNDRMSDNSDHDNKIMEVINILYY